MPQVEKAKKDVEAKPKRTLSEEQLAKLKVARERALEVKKAMKEKSDDDKIKHYEEKIMKIKGRKGEDKNIEEELDNTNINEEQPEEPEEEPEVIQVKSKSKPKAKKKPVVIMEQSESESEDDSNVIYIKRKGRKKEQPLPAPPVQPPPLQRQIIIDPNPFHRYQMNQHYM